MPAYGFFVECEAQVRKEDDVAKFLIDAKALVDAEPGTLARFGVRTGPTSFRIFDAFETRTIVRPTCRARSATRSSPGPRSCSAHHRPSARWTCSPRSSLASRTGRRSRDAGRVRVDHRRFARSV
jgi:hypothetical protein